MPMLQEHRRHDRQLIRPRPYVGLNGSSSGGILYDVSEDGMALDIVGPRPASDHILLNFDLLEIGEHFEAIGRITWKDERQNRVGLQFVDLPEGSRRKIKTWLTKKVAATELLPHAMRQSIARDPARVSYPVKQSDNTVDRKLARSTEASPALTAAAVTATVPEVAPRREVARPVAKTAEVRSNAPLPSAGDDQLVNGLRSSFSKVEAPRPSAPATQFESERVPFDREILEKWITVATVAFLLIVSLAAAKWIYTSPALDRITSLGDLRNIVTKVFNATSDKSEASENSPNTSSNLDEGGHPSRTVKTPGSGEARQDNASHSPKSPRPTQFEVMNAQNGRVTLQPKDVTVMSPSETAGAANVAAVSGGQAASGSLTQEPGGTKVGLVLLHPSPDVPENKVLPEYPALALQKNVQGRVVLRATISKDGALQNVRLVGPPSLLSAPVLEAVKSWRYQPRYQNGVPAEVETQITIDFEISSR